MSWKRVGSYCWKAHEATRRSLVRQRPMNWTRVYADANPAWREIGMQNRWLATNARAASISSGRDEAQEEEEGSNCSAEGCNDPSHHHHHGHNHHHIHRQSKNSPVVDAEDGRKGKRKQMWKSDCWKCGTYLDRVNFFCPGCNVIQQPAKVEKKMTGITHFELLGMKRSFDLDAQHLEKTYWNLQKKLHPDRYGNKTEKEQEYSAEHSSAINHAYNVLKNPLDRSIYLLELHGVDALSEGGKMEMDPFVLMRAMEAREELEECDDLEELNEMKAKSQSDIDAVVAELSRCFEKGDIEGATRTTVKLKYISKLMEEVEQKINSKL